jgi:hypothetical protein
MTLWQLLDSLFWDSVLMKGTKKVNFATHPPIHPSITVHDSFLLL